LTEENHARVVDQAIVWKGLEESHCFQVMVMPSSRRFGLTGPVDGDVLCRRFLKVSQRRLPGLAFQASSRVFIRSKFRLTTDSISRVFV